MRAGIQLKQQDAATEAIRKVIPNKRKNNKILLFGKEIQKKQ